jgi:hypothetical protein
MDFRMSASPVNGDVTKPLFRDSDFGHVRAVVLLLHLNSRRFDLALIALPDPQGRSFICSRGDRRASPIWLFIRSVLHSFQYQS